MGAHTSNGARRQQFKDSWSRPEVDHVGMRRHCAACSEGKTRPRTLDRASDQTLVNSTSFDAAGSAIARSNASRSWDRSQSGDAGTGNCARGLYSPGS
jgi:hypothetical protein